jgi:FtsP/CotA-like multicopper oxidase with cupredoxin domain
MHMIALRGDTGTISVNNNYLVTSASAAQMNIPAPPTSDATYVLTVTVSGGVPTYSWTAK